MNKNYRNFIKFCKIFAAKGRHKKLTNPDFFRVLLWLVCEFSDRDLIPIAEMKEEILMCPDCIDSIIAVLLAGNQIEITDNKELYVK